MAEQPDESGQPDQSEPDAQPSPPGTTGLARVRKLVPWLLAGYLIAVAVALLFMAQASMMLGLVQTDERSAYTMNDLTRVPLPPDDERITDALESWHAAAFPSATDPSTTDKTVLSVIDRSIFWHVTLDVLLLVPALGLVLYWFLRRSFPGPNWHWLAIAPVAYVLVDWAETGWTYFVADRFLRVGGEIAGTGLLVALAAAKWSVLLGCVVAIALGALVRATRFEDTRMLLRLLWRVRVQVVAVLVFTVLVAAPISGPLDQIPDLLRSALDESIASTEFVFPFLLLLAFALLIWSTGMLIAAPGGVAEAEHSYTKSVGAYLCGRWLWIALTVLLLVVGLILQSTDGLRPSPAVWAAGGVAATLLILDAILVLLARSDEFTRISPLALAIAQPIDPSRLTRVVVVLAAVPLFAAGLGVVRAYAPLVLLQSGDPERTVYDGATAWFWGAVVFTVVAPLLLTALLGRCSKATDTTAAPLLLAALGVPVIAISILAGINPAKAGEILEAHGVLTVFLAVVVVVFGWLQWQSEKRAPVPLADVLGLRRTPWIAVVVLVPLVASNLDTDVGYHAVTLRAPAASQESLGAAFERWYDDAAACGEGTEPLPLVLVAAPGGGARAAYWTGQVMAGLAAEDACGGKSVFAASGVSGGSVGLAVWSATSDPNLTEGTEEEISTQDALESLVAPKALSATVAAMLFRDLPRSFVGIHPYGVDRAAIEQDVWATDIPALAEPFYLAQDEVATGWRALLILNGTDIATGCKVIMSQLAVYDVDDPSAQQCKEHPEVGGQAVSALQSGAVDAAGFLDPADCQGNDENLSIAAAALMSARFPYVSPSGTLTSCPETSTDDEATSGDESGQDPEHLYVADGGYLENTGLHSLLALWRDLEPLVASANATEGSRQIVPIAVLVENHYRSQAVVRPSGRVRELTGPPNADRTALLGTESLEQALAAEFRPTTGAVPERHWFVVAPTTHPDVSAPLGWSLSKAARDELDCQIPEPIRRQDLEVKCGAVEAHEQFAILLGLLRADATS